MQKKRNKELVQTAYVLKKKKKRDFKGIFVVVKT